MKDTSTMLMKPLLPCLFLLVILSACAGSKQAVPTDLSLISWSEISSDPDKADAVYQGLAQGEPFLFKIEKGDALPFEVKINLPFVFLSPSVNELRFTEDVFLYVSHEGMLLSPDGVAWAALHEREELKSLFNIKEGFLTLGFSAERRGDPKIKLELGVVEE